MAEDAAGDGLNSRVILPLRPLRFSFDPARRCAVAAAGPGAGDRGHRARAAVLRLAANDAGPRRLSPRPDADADVDGGLALVGQMAARPSTIGRARADTGRRAGRGGDRE